MNRPITTLFLSALVHLTLLLTVPLFVTIEHEPSVERTPLNLHLVTQQFEDDIDVDTSEDERADAYRMLEPPRPTEQKQVLGDAMMVANTAAIAPAAAKAEPTIEPEPEAPPAVLSEQGADDSSFEAALSAETQQVSSIIPDTLTTTGFSLTSAPPDQARTADTAPEQIPMARKQKRMLTKRLRRWADSFYKLNESESRQTWEYEGREYTATFRRPSAPDAMGIEHVIVEVRTEVDGETMSAEMRLKRLAFSSFAQLIDRWDPTVQIHDDELDGRFHSNSLLYVSAGRKIRPQFHGKVTTAARRVQSADPNRPLRRKQIFLGGLETGVRKISLPMNFLAFSSDPSIDEKQIHYLPEDTRITFYPDGAYGWQALESEEPEQVSHLPAGPFYFVSAEKKAIHLRGIVKGKVLVYSPHRIAIEGDLIYAHFPDLDADGDNYLGLVSDKNVEIAHPDVTGPGDLMINASIYARRRFVVRRYRAREKALMFIYGSVTAGSVSATEPRYRTRIQFDQRLEQVRPPSFPVTDRYEIESWDGQWQKGVPGLAF